MARVLVTGDRGYLGSVLAPYLLKRGHAVQGLDTDWFADCTLGLKAGLLADYPRVTRDLREVIGDELEGVEAIVHLAALSNDPLGELRPSLTWDINCHLTIRLARMARRVGVRRFVFVSSQSVYGRGEGDEVLDENARRRPQTAYAMSKCTAENGIAWKSTSNFVVTRLRPATLFGLSPRLRTDLVFNNFLAVGHTTGRLEVHSDGTPWRPLLHVKDACAAIAAVLEAPPDQVQGRAFNVGGPNYQVKDLVREALELLPHCHVVFTGKINDGRSYRTSSARLQEAVGWRPCWSLQEGGAELLDAFRSDKLNADGVREGNRLARIQFLQANGCLNGDLRCVFKN